MTARGRRVGALAVAEGTLLRRNPIALLIGLGMPLAWTLLVSQSQPPHSGQRAADAARNLTALIAAVLLSLVFYNLVTSLVARREELMLKRLRTGELSDLEILLGSALPGIALATAQIGVGMVAAYTVFGLPPPANPVLLMVALVLGTLVFCLLAALTTVITRSVELAQVTAAPLLVASAAFGVLYPVADLPAAWRPLAKALPMTRVVELLRLGFTGPGSWGAAVAPTLVLLAWVAAAAWATRRWFRWEPRR